MIRFKPVLAGLAVAGVLAGALAATHPAVEATHPGGPPTHWVDSWVAMPQLTEPANLPPAPFTGASSVFVNSTLRQTVRITQGGQRMRLRISNAFGGAPLPVTAVSVALPAGGQAGVSAIQPGSSRPVTFHGRPSAVVPVGAQLVSDPFDLDLPARANLTVTLFLADGQASTDITSHPGSRTTSYAVAGNHLADLDLPGATPITHWYFLSGLEVQASERTSGVVLLGDSLTDGRGSTTNGNDRWPDQLLDRLQGERRTSDIAVLNEAAGGNRILHDGLGPNVLARLDRDVLARSGASWLLVFEGINDIGTADATPAAQQQVGDDLIAAYDQIITRAHAAGLRVYGATITPFGGNNLYDEPTGLREATRQTVNRWIRTGGEFDAVVDFDAVARDPGNPRQLRPAYDTGDHLHLTPTGYRALADAVPTDLFRS